MANNLENNKLPQHIAIIMDGNGRWAKKRFLPRVAGHARGVVRVHQVIRHCAKLGVKYLTLFAFSKENWCRPNDEVSFLMNLLYEQLGKQLKDLHKNNINVKFIGDRTNLDHTIIQKIDELETLTQANTQLYLTIALDYSGKFDIIQAVNKIIAQTLNNKDHNYRVNEVDFEKHLLTYTLPNPDLLIRTSGESRLSNFMLWQLAYTECYFTDKLWPDFSIKQLELALLWFNSRERRFGMISEQL